jgi:hypothetical protein
MKPINGMINVNQNSDGLKKKPNIDGSCVLFSHQWFSTISMVLINGKYILKRINH